MPIDEQVREAVIDLGRRAERLRGEVDELVRAAARLEGRLERELGEPPARAETAADEGSGAEEADDG